LAFTTIFAYLRSFTAKFAIKVSKKMGTENEITIGIEVDYINKSVKFDNVPYYIKKKERYWFAYAPNFRATGYSDKSEKDAIEELNNSLKAFFALHIEEGTLDDALISFGLDIL